MKLIEAVIHQHKLLEVRCALGDMGVQEFVESAIRCHSQKTRVMRFRGAEFVANVVEKVKLEIVAADDAVENIIKAIRYIGNAGNREECRIGIRPYLEVS